MTCHLRKQFTINEVFSFRPAVHPLPSPYVGESQPLFQDQIAIFEASQILFVAPPPRSPLIFGVSLTEFR